MLNASSLDTPKLVISVSTAEMLSITSAPKTSFSRKAFSVIRCRLGSFAAIFNCCAIAPMASAASSTPLAKLLAYTLRATSAYFAASSADTPSDAVKSAVALCIWFEMLNAAPPTASAAPATAAPAATVKPPSTPPIFDTNPAVCVCAPPIFWSKSDVSPMSLTASVSISVVTCQRLLPAPQT